MTLLLVSWLLFFPNAPYILTDLFHLKLTTGVPVWYDLILILSYAWTGMFLGFLSLRDLESMLLLKWKPRRVQIFVSGLLFLASLGVYLGRFLRWNSWDILQHPMTLLGDVADRFFHPMDHPRTWGVTILLGLFLNMVYMSFKFIGLDGKTTLIK